MTEMQSGSVSFFSSYRWVIIIAGIIGLFASLGLGRFSLGMMLPAMGKGLQLSYSQMGVISTLNFCGYLGAVLLCGPLISKIGSRNLITAGLFLVASTMMLVGFTSSYFIILILYFCTGVGSALSNVPIMGLIAVWFSKENRGKAAGLCVVGNGLGLVVAGKYVPILNSLEGSWRQSWIVLGTVAGIATLICYFLFRDRPTDTVTEISKASADDAKDSQEKPPPAQQDLERKRTEVKQRGSKNIFYHCAAIYFLFGFTYVIYVTFFVTALVQERGISESLAGSLWSWMGVISLISGPLFGFFSDKCGRKIALMTVFFLQTAAYLLVASNLPMFGVYISLLFYGLAAWSIPTIMAALVGDYAGPEKATAMFGFVTFIFGIGQIVGPAIGGWLGDITGSFSQSFFLAASMTGLAIVLSFLLPRAGIEEES